MTSISPFLDSFQKQDIYHICGKTSKCSQSAYWEETIGTGIPSCLRWYKENYWMLDSCWPHIVPWKMATAYKVYEVFKIPATRANEKQKILGQVYRKYILETEAEPSWQKEQPEFVIHCYRLILQLFMRLLVIFAIKFTVGVNSKLHMPNDQLNFEFLHFSLTLIRISIFV